MKTARRRLLNLGLGLNPELPGRYPTAAGLTKSAKPDRDELAKVIGGIESALLIPHPRIYSVVLDALYHWAQVHEVQGLPFSERTAARFEERWGKRFRQFTNWKERNSSW
mgnify:CR=1 FL=1